MFARLAGKLLSVLVHPVLGPVLDQVMDPVQIDPVMDPWTYKSEGTHPMLPAAFIVTIPVSSGFGSVDFATEVVFVFSLVFQSDWYRWYGMVWYE